MRLFLAYNFDEQIIDIIENSIVFIKDKLKEKSKSDLNFKINYVRRDSYHITIKFFEDQNPDYIIKLLKNSSENFSLNGIFFSLKGLNAFPDKKQPRVLIYPVFDEKKLIERNFNIVEEILFKGGINKESKRFNPHLTIARIKYCTKTFFNDFEYWGKYPGIESKELFFNLGKLKLYQSTLTPEGPIYKELTDI
ncbi:MAG: RNA 2',3'-cyclic phosphodiesterase [Exilispira sp.]